MSSELHDGYTEELRRALGVMMFLCQLKYGNLDEDVTTELEKAEELLRKGDEQ